MAAVTVGFIAYHASTAKGVLSKIVFCFIVVCVSGICSPITLYRPWRDANMDFRPIPRRLIRPFRRVIPLEIVSHCKVQLKLLIAAIKIFFQREVENQR
jgi:hypothetical protein